MIFLKGKTWTIEVFDFLKKADAEIQRMYESASKKSRIKATALSAVKY